jgi:hypothetical protein
MRLFTFVNKETFDCMLSRSSAAYFELLLDITFQIILREPAR